MTGFPLPEVTIDDFAKIDIRVGTVVNAEPFPEAKKPAIKLEIEFGGEVGRRKSSAQLSKNYKPEQLVGKQVAAVINFPPRQIGPMQSEVLLLCFPAGDGVTLVVPDSKVPDGGRMF